MSAWSTGPVGTNHRAILRDGRVVAVAESVEEAAHIVRWMNTVSNVLPSGKTKWREMEELKANLRKLAEDPPDPDQDMETIPL